MKRRTPRSAWWPALPYRENTRSPAHEEGGQSRITWASTRAPPDFHRHDRDPVRLLGPSAVIAGLTLAIQRPLAGIDKATTFRDRPPVHVHLGLSPVKVLSLQSAAAPRFPPVLADARLLTRSRSVASSPRTDDHPRLGGRRDAGGARREAGRAGVIWHPELVNLYGCRIGDDTRIGAFVEIQKGASIGRLCKVQSHSFICTGVTIEDEVFVGHYVA